MKKTAVQLDFDGTVTLEDISYLLLDRFSGGDWHMYLDEYASGDISVGSFNQSAFGMIKADEKTLTDFVLNSPRTVIRPGLKDFTDYCAVQGLKIIVVSNGLTFYIKAILKKLDIEGPEIHAAENVFSPAGMRVRYLDPDGKEVDTGFKETYTDMLLREGHEVIYIGNGSSDISPARKARYVFATANLLRRCRLENLNCYPYEDFHDVIETMKNLKLD
jgi:2-hydroxy-3-keto-5-methylthiopentenyl-1-phosphate phosphatase